MSCCEGHPAKMAPCWLPCGAEGAGRHSPPPRAEKQELHADPLLIVTPRCRRCLLARVKCAQDGPPIRPWPACLVDAKRGNQQVSCLAIIEVKLVLTANRIRLHVMIKRMSLTGHDPGCTQKSSVGMTCLKFTHRCKPCQPCRLRTASRRPDPRGGLSKQRAGLPSSSSSTIMPGMKQRERSIAHRRHCTL